MKKLIFISILFLSLKDVWAQDSLSYLLNDFYHKTLIDYYAYDSNILENENIFIVTDSRNIDLPKKINQVEFSYISRERLIKLLGKRKTKNMKYAFLGYDILGPDTIDIKIESPSIKVKNTLGLKNGKIITKKVVYSVSCGGTMGYIPSARFIFSSERNVWEFYSYDMLYKEKIEEREKRLELWKSNY